MLLRTLLEAVQYRVVHGLDRPTGWIGLGWGGGVGSRLLAFWWAGLGRGSETFPKKILKLGRPLVTGKVIT